MWLSPEILEERREMHRRKYKCGYFRGCEELQRRIKVKKLLSNAFGETG